MNLAVCYRSGGVVGCEEANPRLSSYLRFTVIATSRGYPSRSFITDSDVFGMFTTLRLPRVWLPGGSSARALDPTLLCFAALSDPLFIQDRRFIQPHGWWYREYHSSYWRPRVARGLGRNGTENRVKTYPPVSQSHRALDKQWPPQF